jgi:hypothetical protein
MTTPRHKELERATRSSIWISCCRMCLFKKAWSGCTLPHFDYAGEYWEAFSPQCNVGALIRCQVRGFLVYVPLNWLMVVQSGLFSSLFLVG